MLYEAMLILPTSAFAEWLDPRVSQLLQMRKVLYHVSQDLWQIQH